MSNIYGAQSLQNEGECKAKVNFINPLGNTAVGKNCPPYTVHAMLRVCDERHILRRQRVELHESRREAWLHNGKQHVTNLPKTLTVRNSFKILTSMLPTSVARQHLTQLQSVYRPISLQKFDSVQSIRILLCSQRII